MRGFIRRPRVATERPLHALRGTFEWSTSFLGMRQDMHTQAPPSDDANHPRAGGDNSLWAFLPILVGLAALCLLMFFFLSPSFEVADPVSAKSARPGAETSVTTLEDNKSVHSR
jgi:hypothetical protein